MQTNTHFIVLTRCVWRWRVATGLLCAIALCVVLGSADRAVAGVVGSFSIERAGFGSLSDDPDNQPFRDVIVAAVPGTTFTSTSTITAEYLATVDVFYIRGRKGISEVVAPLSASEQTAVLDFVRGGRSVIIVTDNEEIEIPPIPDVSYESMLDPFRIDTTGRLALVTGITIVDTMNPITNGPFGPVTSLAAAAPGWFDDLGPYASALATIDDNGQPIMAWIDYDVIAPGSGFVGLLSDGSPLTAFDQNAQNLVANTMYHALAPEPASLVLLAVGGLTVGGRAGRRRRRERRARTRRSRIAEAYPAGLGLP